MCSDYANVTLLRNHSLRIINNISGTDIINPLTVKYFNFDKKPFAG